MVQHALATSYRHKNSNNYVMCLSYTHMHSTSPTVFSAFIGCAFLDMSEMTTHFSKEKKKPRKATKAR